jgi:hypothetical protein
MKKLIIFYLFLFLLASCHNNTHKGVTRMSVQSIPVIHNLYTSMPGILLIYNDYILLSDPFAKTGFIKIYQLSTGEELNAIGTIGKGPDECLMPDITDYFQNQLLLFDVSLQQKALIPIDSIIQSKYNPIHLTHIPVPGIHSIIKTGDDEYVVSDFLQPVPFHLIEGGKVIDTFGKKPIDEDANTFKSGANEISSDQTDFCICQQSKSLSCRVQT